MHTIGLQLNMPIQYRRWLGRIEPQNSISLTCFIALNKSGCKKLMVAVPCSLHSTGSGTGKWLMVAVEFVSPPSVPAALAYVNARQPRAVYKRRWLRSPSAEALSAISLAERGERSENQAGRVLLVGTHPATGTATRSEKAPRGRGTRCISAAGAATLAACSRGAVTRGARPGAPQRACRRLRCKRLGRETQRPAHSGSNQYAGTVTCISPTHPGGGSCSRSKWFPFIAS